MLYLLLYIKWYYQKPQYASAIIMAWSMQALAKQYPQQVYFPFQLSRQHYGPQGQGRAQQLQPLLRLPLMEEWGAALNDITYPEQRWQGWAARLTSLFAAGKKVRLTVVASAHETRVLLICSEASLQRAYTDLSAVRVRHSGNACMPCIAGKMRVR